MRKLYALVFVAMFFVGALPVAHAASLYIDPHTAQLNRGDIIAVNVRLDTDEDECVNTVDGVVTYSDNIEPVDTSRGNSIFSIWVQEPTIDKKNHTISFAGGIPNGYCGRIQGDPRLTNSVLTLLFRSPGMVVGSSANADKAHIDFDPHTQVLLNDGFGTQASLTTYGSDITLSTKPGGQIKNPWKDAVDADTIKPEKFSVTLNHTKNAFSGRYYITFNTTDKQSGIDHYEVIEEPLESQNLFGWGAATAPWKTIKSPYVLTDQSLNSIIRVKAVDKAGNEYIATLVPDISLRGISLREKAYIALGITGSIVLIVLVVFAFFFLRKRKSISSESFTEEDIDNEII